MNPPNLRARKTWVFDLDGTLTIAAHDFDAMAQDLGLPKGRPILESLAQLPAEEQAPLHTRLQDWELHIAKEARRAPGALELITYLHSSGAYLGILTRNTRTNAWVTLQAIGLADAFAPNAVLGRDEAPPKPSPEGIQIHLERWNTSPSSAVMVGDYAFDLQAGRAAGVATVYVDPSGKFPHATWADVSVKNLSELMP